MDINSFLKGTGFPPLWKNCELRTTQLNTKVVGVIGSPCMTILSKLIDKHFLHFMKLTIDTKQEGKGIS